MRRATIGLSLVMLIFLSAWAQPRRFGEPAPPAFDPAPVEAAVREFYAAYWRAWETHDRNALANLIARDFVSTAYLPGTGLVHDDYARALAAVGIFFDAVRGQQMAWNRNLLSIMVRSEEEAVAALRTGFVRAGSAQSELSLEVIRKEADGQWRLVRRWSEKYF
ncbi:MAG: hypothetical protein ACE5H2_09455 [Terriglobia bacterium]